MKEVPLFIVNGFLESGKTTLIKEIIENNENYHDNTTVLIVCEEGEVEYDEAWLDKYGIHIEYVEDQSQLNPNFLRNLDKVFMPDRFVIEYNGFYDIDTQEFPDYMVVYQQITLINSQTFSVMFNNMRKVFQSLVKYSSLVIFNRIDGVKDLGACRRSIRGLNQDCQIAFEQANGSLTQMLEEDLPYDLSKDVISFEEDVYPVWYIEVFDNYEKYFHKTFKFKTFVRDITKNSLVVGRNVMTCCAEDIQFLGYELINVPKDIKVEIGDCIFLECEVTRGYSKIAKEEVVLLEYKGLTKLPKEEDKVLSM